MQSKIESAQGDSRRLVSLLRESNRLPESAISVFPLEGKRGGGYNKMELAHSKVRNLEAASTGKIKLQDASIDIWDKKYRLKTKDGAIVDNDINGTDFCIGYDTALNTVVEAIDKIRDTANSHNRLFLVEVMGRDAGDIALNAGIGAGAEEILIPEQNMGKDRLLASLKRSKKSGKTSSIVVVAEGDQIGKNIMGLADYIRENLNEYKVKVTVLGHIQRGGAPSCFDRVLASRLGVAAVDALLAGEHDVMIGVSNKKVVIVPFSEAIKGDNEIDLDLIRVADITSV